MVSVYINAVQHVSANTSHHQVCLYAAVGWCTVLFMALVSAIKIQLQT